MPKGLKIPVGVDQRGRAATERNESNNTLKIIELAFAEGNDLNPFQLLGVDKRLLFSPKDASFSGKAMRAIRQVLNKFPELVKLDESEQIKFNRNVEGEIEIQFRYIDLLTGRPVQFNKKFKAVQRTG